MNPIREQKRSAASAPYSFEVAQHGDKYEFTYKRSKYGFAVLFGLCVVVGLPLWLIFFWMLKSAYLSNVGLTPLYWSLFFTFCLYLLINRRRKGHFTISKMHLSVNGRDYDRSHVLGIFVREPRNDYVSAHAVAAVLHSVIAQMQESNHSICFSYGESRVKLAGGLSDVSAQTMLNKIEQVLKNNNL